MRLRWRLKLTHVLLLAECPHLAFMLLKLLLLKLTQLVKLELLLDQQRVNFTQVSSLAGLFHFDLRELLEVVSR